MLITRGNAIRKGLDGIGPGWGEIQTRAPYGNKIAILWDTSGKQIFYEEKINRNTFSESVRTHQMDTSSGPGSKH